MSAPPVRDPSRRVAVQARETVDGLVGALADLWRRPVRHPAVRMARAGPLMIVGLAVLTVALVALSMLFVDPLTLGLRARLPAGVARVAERLTDLGLGSVVLWPLGIALVALVAARPRFDRMGRRVASALIARVGFLFIAIAGAGLFVTVVKRLIGRARPHVAQHLAGADPQLTFHWLSWKASYASLPSGHATTTFATAVAFALLFPRARYALLTLAAAVATTRVLLGAHFPSDIIAGGAVGAAFALWMAKLFATRRLVFRVDAHGAMAPMAGPGARRLGLLLPWSRRSSISVEEARS